MKTKLLTLALSGISTLGYAYEDKLLSTPWEFIRAEKLADVATPSTSHGDPKNYKYGHLPFPNDPRWVGAPHVGEELHFDEVSRIPMGQAYKKLDFTYFRSYVHVPHNMSISKFTVTINQVDDGARMYLFNNNNVGGSYVEANQAKLNGDKVTSDFTKTAITGWNMVVIVQFDDAPTENKLTGGVHISVNGDRPDPNVHLKALKMTPKDIAFIPKKFIVETYGVDGKGKGADEPRHFMGSKDAGVGIIRAKESGAESNTAVVKILREDLGSGLIALKIAGSNKYLPDLSPAIAAGNKFRVVPPLYHQRDLSSKDAESYNFVSLQSVSDPETYLRHSNYKVLNGKPTAGERVAGSKSEKIFQQDSTWHFHVVK